MIVILIALLFLLMLMLIGGAVWYFYIRKDDSEAVVEEAAVEEAAVEEAAVEEAAVEEAAVEEAENISPPSFQLPPLKISSLPPQPTPLILLGRGASKKSGIADELNIYGLGAFDRMGIVGNGCGSLNQFKYNKVNADTNKGQYSFTCFNGLVDNSLIINKSTDYNNSSKIPNYLDRHDVDCGANRLLKNFKTVYKNGKIKYDYNCGNAINGIQCRNLKTSSQPVGTSLAYLDRHDVKCSKDEALQKFRLRTTDSGRKMHYDYTCCGPYKHS